MIYHITTSVKIQGLIGVYWGFSRKYHKLRLYAYNEENRKVHLQAHIEMIGAFLPFFDL